MLIGTLFLLALVSLPSPAALGIGQHERRSGAVVSASLIFPPANMTDFKDRDNLTSFLVQAVGLPPMDPKLTSVQGFLGTRPQGSPLGNQFESIPGSYICCKYDWTNRVWVITNVTQVMMMSSVGGVNILLEYSGTAKLAHAEVDGPAGPSLASTDDQALLQRVADIGGRLRIPFLPQPVVMGSCSWNRMPRCTTVAALTYSSGLPVAFGNELRVNFDLDRRIVTKIDLYPWFSAPAAMVTPTRALSNALDFLNASLGPPGEGFAGKADIYFAFDFLRYSLVYQVDALYGQHYRLWIDPYDGSLVFWVPVFPHLGGPPGEVPFPWQALAYGILVAGALLVVITVFFLEPTHLGMVAALLPLYLRLRKDNALDHFLRGQIYWHIVTHPATSYSEIRDTFSLNNGTATYHLAVLESLGFVRSTTGGIHKRFFPEGVQPGVLARRLSGLQYRILETIRASGPMSPSEIARALGISRQRARYNLWRMEGYGFLRREEHAKFALPGGAGVKEEGQSPATFEP